MYDICITIYLGCAYLPYHPYRTMRANQIELNSVTLDRYGHIGDLCKRPFKTST